MDERALARRYYRAIDEGAYDDLASVLQPGFTHRRPDRTLDGRESFVEFMREERPDPDTSHVVEALLTGEGRVAVEGRLLDAGGDELFGFVDVFEFEDSKVSQVRTYTD